MGWAVNDTDKLEGWKVGAAETRSALYSAKAQIVSLQQELSKVEHAEKRESLILSLQDAEAFLQKAFNSLDDVTQTLNR